jgi:hypothetical protein
MKLALLAALLLSSSNALAFSKAECFESTSLPGKDSVYKKLPLIDVRTNACHPHNKCRYGKLKYTSVIFPQIDVHIEADTKGETNIRIVDRGTLNPAKGKKAYTSVSASGKGVVLASYNVTEGDEFPLAGTSLTIACEVK